MTLKTQLLVPILCWGALAARAQSSAAPEVGLVEKLGQTIPLDVELYDEKGNLTPLQSVLKKPAILTFVYYKCPGICSPLLTELARMVEKMDLKPGVDYQILTISFDHRETPDVALEKQENYLSTIRKPVAPEAWRFFTADSVTIRKLTGAAGFYFKPDGKDWLHPAALIFVTPEGKITRYINGIEYLPFDIKMALIEASEGRTGPTIARVLRICYSYDPESHTYAFNFLRVGMILTLVFVVGFVVLFIVKPRGKSAERGVHGKSQ
jgi:protein SCO1